MALADSLTTGVIDPEAAVDRSCWPLLEGLLPDGADRSSLERETQPLAVWSVLRSALVSLWAGRWEDAGSSARDALRVSSL